MDIGGFPAGLQYEEVSFDTTAFCYPHLWTCRLETFCRSLGFRNSRSQENLCKNHPHWVCYRLLGRDCSDNRMYYILKKIDRNSSFTPITKASLKKKTININQLLVFWTLVAKELGRRVLASRNIQADLRTLLSAGVVSIQGSHIWLRDITRCWLPSELLSCLCSQQMIWFPYGFLDIYGVFAPLSMFAPLLLKRVEQPRNMFHRWILHQWFGVFIIDVRNKTRRDLILKQFILQRK